MVIQGFQLKLKLSAPVGGSWCIFSQLDETPLSHCLSGPSGVNRAEELLLVRATLQNVEGSMP